MRIGLWVSWQRTVLAVLLLCCASLGLVAQAASPETAKEAAQQVAQDQEALGLQPVPALTARVIDQTKTLSAEQMQALEAKLAAFEQRKGSQIVVLLVASTQPEDIASYANRIANSWKIGRQEVGDGLLLIVAKDERKMRFEVAKTLEGALPDLAASRIINNTMKPAFRQGDFAGGIDAGLDQAMAVIDGEALPEPQAHQPKGKSASWVDRLINFALLALFFVPVAASALGRVMGQKLGAVATALVAGLLVWALSSWLFLGLGAAVLVFFYALLSAAAGGGTGPIVFGGGAGGGLGGGWGGGGFGGGGFGSGGGGDFGGGGASGDW